MQASNGNGRSSSCAIHGLLLRNRRSIVVDADNERIAFGLIWKIGERLPGIRINCVEPPVAGPRVAAAQQRAAIAAVLTSGQRLQVSDATPRATGKHAPA